MSKRERRKLEVVAYHEAGHAVMSVMLDHGLSGATIAPTDEAQGKVTNNIPRSIQRKLQDEQHDLLAQWFEHQVIVTLAGTAAQRRAFPRMRWKYGHGYNSSQLFVTPGSDAQMVARLIYERYGNGKLAYCCDNGDG
jgi:hypothetical protein